MNVIRRPRAAAVGRALAILGIALAGTGTGTASAAPSPIAAYSLAAPTSVATSGLVARAPAGALGHSPARHGRPHAGDLRPGCRHAVVQSQRIVMLSRLARTITPT